jgi:hypothetical protein
MKYNAVDVANEMEVLMNGNEYVFDPDQWLTSTQIQCFWSRLTKTRRQTSQKQSKENSSDAQIEETDEGNGIEERDEDDEIFEQASNEVKTRLSTKKEEQERRKKLYSTSTNIESPSLSRKTKQDQRSSDNLTAQQQIKRSSNN